MKNIICVLFTFCTVFAINAQDQDINDEQLSGEHEVKLNALYLVLGAFEVNYEYLLNENSGIGVNAFLPYDDEVKDDIEYYISPYYRYYFGKKYAGGFFLEGFGMLNSTERDFDLFFENSEDNFKTDFALGIGFGGKWITKSGFVGELSYGIGRNLFEDETNDIVGKGGISIGYRF